MSPEQRRIYDDIVRSRGTWLNGPFAPMLHQPRLAEPAHLLGDFVRYNTSLPPEMSELAIILVARHFDCHFEWSQHARIALAAGVRAELVEAIRNDVTPAELRADEARIYDFTTDLLRKNRISEEHYQAVHERFGLTGAVELVGLIGYYTLIAFTLNAHEVPLPAGVPPPLPDRAETKTADRHD
jgi:4-carboxymuconolactone decarboxylase